MNEEVITLKTQKQSLISRLRHVLTSQLELMDVLEIDDMDISKLKDRTKKVFSATKEHTGTASSAEKTQDTPSISTGSLTTETKVDGEKTESNLFKDVFGDDMDPLVK